MIAQFIHTLIRSLLYEKGSHIRFMYIYSYIHNIFLFFFCYDMFCFVLFCFVLFCFVLFLFTNCLQFATFTILIETVFIMKLMTVYEWTKLWNEKKESKIKRKGKNLMMMVIRFLYTYLYILILYCLIVFIYYII